MAYWLLFVILTVGGDLVSFISAQFRQYHFVDTSLNWTEAQGFCRQNHSDLATIASIADLEASALVTSNHTGKAWIGLYDDLVNGWKWSLNDSSFYGEGEAEFRHWAANQPDNRRADEYCVAFFPDSYWADIKCGTLLPFVCYGKEADHGNLSLITSHKNWTEAQKFCRENFLDLASVRNQTENDNIKALALNPVWIGMHRERSWSDGSTALFRSWENGQPDNSAGNEYCVASSSGVPGSWSDEDCANTLPFICYTEIPCQQFFVDVTFEVSSSSCNLSDIISARLRAKLIERGLPADFTLNLEIT